MTEYAKPSLTVDAVVLAGLGDETRILVIRRANNPFAGSLALPGGFVDEDELPYHAVTRELAEETGLVLKGVRFIPLNLRARKGRDPRGWTMSQPFLFWIPQPQPVQAGDDARQAFWEKLSHLPPLAFDHGAMLCEALGRFWPDMPTHAPVFQGIRPFGVPEPRGRHIFFGGTFNPWHQGHATCVQQCPDPENLVVVPDSNPFKHQTAHQCSWQHYLSLVAHLDGLAERVFPGWCGSELPNPTANWFPAVPGSNALLLGDDSLASLPGWLDASRLARSLTRLFILPRKTPASQISSAQTWLKQQNPNCELTFLADHPFRHLSSTEIREEGINNRV